MDFIEKYIKGETVKKIFAILVLIALLFAIKSMLNLLLLTFVFSYLFYRMEDFIHRQVTKLFPIRRKIVIILTYLVLISLFIVALLRYVPIAIEQLTLIFGQLSDFDSNSYKELLDPRIRGVVDTINIEEYLKTAGKTVLIAASGIGSFSFDFVLSLVLSLFFLLEKEEIMNFLRGLEDSKVSFFYKYYREFGKNFLNSFGNVIQTQILIAFINSTLSTIALTFMGFPQTIGLGLMIFLLGLIPVAGVFISLIPLCIIAFKLGGLMQIVYVLVMIAVLHALESYVLNPKLMSRKIKLPEFFTLITLLLSEHFLGIWGLLIGLPLFMFFLDFLEIKHIPLKKKK